MSGKTIANWLLYLLVEIVFSDSFGVEFGSGTKKFKDACELRFFTISGVNNRFANANEILKGVVVTEAVFAHHCNVLTAGRFLSKKLKCWNLPKSKTIHCEYKLFLDA